MHKAEENNYLPTHFVQSQTSAAVTRMKSTTIEIPFLNWEQTRSEGSIFYHTYYHLYFSGMSEKKKVYHDLRTESDYNS